MSTSPNITTGYGIVSKNLMEGLKDKVDIKMLGLQNIGHQKEDWNLPILNDIYGSDALEFYIKLYGIDYIITILDNWAPQYSYLPNLIKKLRVGHICHVTANSTPLSPILFDKIKHADFFIAPSRFVESLLLKLIDKKRVKKIYHGVDTKIFKPFSEEEINKHKAMTNYKDKFIFLSVATNRGYEKGWANLFYAYKIFLAQNPDAKKDTILHAHTSMQYPGGYDLKLLAEFYGISKNIFYIEGISLNAGSPPEEMAKLYNISDCFVSASMGESFGLPILESMACGVPQVFPNHTVGPELIKEPKTGFLAELLKMKNGQEYGWTGPTISDKWLVDPVDLAEKMGKIYNSDNLRKKFSKNAVKFAQKFDWQKNIIPEWLKFFEYVENFVELDYRRLKLGI